MIYDEPVEVETIAKHLADQCQQFTQYAGVRPFGVALIIGGVDEHGSSLYLTDPSGTYIAYDAVAIGSGSDVVADFLEKSYNPSMSLDDAGALAVAAIYLVSEEKEGSKHIKMSQIKSDTKKFEIIPEDQIVKYANVAKQKYPSEKK